MSSVSFDLTGNALAQLDRLIAQCVDTKPIMDGIGNVLASKVRQGFRTSTDPWGKQWKPLKRRKGQPLVDTGRLRSSISYHAISGSVAVGTNVSYAPYHQFGFTINKEVRAGEVYFKRNRDGSVGNRFVRKSVSDFAQSVIFGAHTVTVPARPYLPITPQHTVDLPASWQADVADIIRQHWRQA